VYIEVVVGGTTHVKRNFMPTLIDPHERELPRLSHLSMHDTVGARDTGEARFLISRWIEIVRNNLATKPIAVVVCVAKVHYQGDVGVQ
jgi:hypothetical protein